MNYNELWHQLAQKYDEGEAKAIARMAYEVHFGLTLSDLCLGKDTQLSADDQTELEEIAMRLLQGEPIQYVLGQADFCGRTFKVNEHVLIPRPETEELVRWIVLKETTANILDIGTGSGCIAITLAAMYPKATVTAWDISEKALKVARTNAIRHKVNVLFQQVDILANSQQPKANSYDIIISNPPYICNKEREAMEQNVLDYEPHEALFVPDEDPLLFYRAIAEYGKKVLKPDGWLYFEINPLYAEPLRELLHSMSYHDIECKDDQYGKQRMMRAQR